MSSSVSVGKYWRMASCTESHLHLAATRSILLPLLVTLNIRSTSSEESPRSNNAVRIELSADSMDSSILRLLETAPSVLAPRRKDLLRLEALGGASTTWHAQRN